MGHPAIMPLSGGAGTPVVINSSSGTGLAPGVTDPTARSRTVPATFRRLTNAGHAGTPLSCTRLDAPEPPRSNPLFNEDLRA